VIGNQGLDLQGEVFDQPEAERRPRRRPKPQPRPRRQPQRRPPVECKVTTHDAAKRTKFRKQFKGKFQAPRSVAILCVRRIRPQSHRSLPHDRREIEAARRAISRYVKARRCESWIRVFPDVPITQKPLEVRMGSGKGTSKYWVARVLPGKVLFEIEGMSEEIAREAFRLASAKLSVSTAFVNAKFEREGTTIRRKRFAREGARRSRRGSSQAAPGNNSTCAWRGRRASRRSRISLQRSARTLRA